MNMIRSPGPARIGLALLSVGLCGWAGGNRLHAQTSYEHEPFNYATATVDDPVARLQRRLLKTGQPLKFDEEQGYLRDLLDELDIPISSQTLVFSRTSFQRSRISPRTPRALYFNDDVYVGWVQGGDMIELSAADPRLGGVFYTLPQEPPPTAPSIVRETGNCLVCHATSRTGNVPGHVLRSVYPDATGMPLFSAGTYDINHSTPLETRWGGWYVTGQCGPQGHLGNVTYTGRGQPAASSSGDAQTELAERFDVSKYLSPHSDIVAHLVLDHQVQMHNEIARASYDGRLALFHSDAMNKALGTPLGEHSEGIERRLKNAGQSLLETLLFVEEASLKGPIVGDSEFAEEFARRGPRDRQGRSLRDFDLQTRIFKYPCSYLIYSEALDALPAQVKDHFYRRLWEILAAEAPPAPFDRLSAEDRRAIREIVAETKPGLPDYWSATR